MKPWHAEDEDVVAFLKIASNTNNLPVFVHCQRGADRTGMMCAMYRIVLLRLDERGCDPGNERGRISFQSRLGEPCELYQ